MSIKFIHLRDSRLFSTQTYSLFNSIPAGFPSPADDYLEASLSLDELLIKNPSSTFFVRVEGYSMIGAGIYPDDILIVDRSLKAKLNDVVIAFMEGEFTVKRLVKINEEYFLQPENNDFKNIPIPKNDFMVWGIVIFVIHKPSVL